MQVSAREMTNMKVKQSLRAALVNFGRWRTVLATAATVGATDSFRNDSMARAYGDQAYEAVISEGPALPQGRACHAGGIVGGRVVVAGGSAWNAARTAKIWFDDSLVFDAERGGWSAGPRLPYPVAEMMFGCDESAVYVAGGKNGGTTRAEAYRFVSRDGSLAIQALTPLPTPLSGGAGAVLDGQFYVAGGYDMNGDMTDGLWALDIKHSNAGWRPLAAMPAPSRGYFGLVACDGALYALGGCIVETDAQPIRRVFKDVYRYDPQRDKWSQRPPLPTAGQGWVADAVDDHHLLIAGRGDTDIYDEVWLVDLRDSSVRGVGNLIVRSFGAPLVRVGANRWWFIGGEPDATKSRTPRVSVIELK